MEGFGSAGRRGEGQRGSRCDLRLQEKRHLPARPRSAQKVEKNADWTAWKTFKIYYF